MLSGHVVSKPHEPVAQFAGGWVSWPGGCGGPMTHVKGDLTLSKREGMEPELGICKYPSTFDS